MKIAAAILERFVALPADCRARPRGLRDLLDDLGVEVKRQEGDRLTLELLANRGDHHCYEGVAREIAARLGQPLCVPPAAPLEVGPAPVPLRIETPLCLRYSLTRLVGHGGALDADADAVLAAAGLASVHPVVDATNVANLELGQPSHAFDAARVRGGITVRTARAGERAWLLFEAAPREIPADTLVIADDEKILAVAGVIGCEDSKTTAETREVLLESACFDPVAVRRARRALGLTTDASARFERGSDPARVLTGAGRVVQLLAAAGWTATGPTGMVGDWADPERTLWFSLADANAALGIHLSLDRATDLLQRLGFSIAIGADGQIGARVPPHRLWDVVHRADVYEELLKIAGYETPAATLPLVDGGAPPADGQRRRAEAVLTAAGLFEAITDGFYARPLRERLLSHLPAPEQHPLWAHVETTNALDRAYGLLKNNALAQALEAVAENQRVRALDIKLYEWTRTFHPTGADAATGRMGADERPVLWAIATGTDRPRSWADKGRAVDVHWASGLVAELGGALGVPLAIRSEVADPLADALHPGRRASVWWGDRAIGLFGEVHPSVLAAWKIKGLRPVFLCLDAAALLGAERQRPTFREPPTWTPIERSLAFTLPARIAAGQVQAVLQSAAPPWMSRLAIVDRFDHEDDGAPVRTVTYALTFDNADNDRTTEAVNAATEAMIHAVQSTCGPSGVRLRA